jgi:hypothetical protein
MCWTTTCMPSICAAPITLESAVTAPSRKLSSAPSKRAPSIPIFARRKKLGIGAPGEARAQYVPNLNGPDHMEIIAPELARRGPPSSVIEKVLGANFQRVPGKIWGTA